MRGASAEGGSVSRHRHGGQLAVGGDVEEFLAVAPPLRLRTPGDRDLRLPGRRRKRADVHFERAGFVRGVCYPTGVRRKATLRFIDRRTEKRARLALSGQCQHTQVVSAIRQLTIQKKPSIA